MNEDNLILELKKGNRSVLKTIYTNNRDAFIKYALNSFNVNEDDIIDVYQDAIIALYLQARNGKMDHLSCSIKTYLFSIGKYMVYDKARKEQREVKKIDEMNDEIIDFESFNTVFFREELTTEQKQIQNKFEQLGKKCQEILTLFYYEGLTIDEITKFLGYASKNTLKSQKSRCLKSLRDKFNL
jgi:RNA polymerase sigma factor (sigma-70 family)